MNILKDSRVKEYISSLDGLSPVQYVPTVCQCIKENFPENAHSDIAYPFSNNLAELAANQGPKNIRLIVMYITKTSFFNGDTMKFLVNEMLECKEDATVEQYYNVLDQNFKMHPPCAQYMDTEYEQLILGPYRKCFGEMTLWDYIIERLNQITSGSLLYGDNKAFDLAFKRCFSFCVCILQMDFEVSKKRNIRSLIAKCLKYNSERKTRMSEITKLLDMLFNTGYDFQMPVINLAILVNQLK
ncbi:uncharacterized protein LOC112599676 [Melanaphis sacchari]|uniref:uncharacterized protein LOC112599676 n=1 Tax=Melanaphis sacchari TaxID=742174 RepID=UPI000DC1582D|nr:uncharacterized protein LOC112599676 [Melanaphis sacchari]